MLILWFNYAMINIVFSIIYFGNLQIKIPKDIIGSVFGSILTIFSIINTLAAVASSYLVSIFSVATLIIIFSIVMLISYLFVYKLTSLKTTFD